jgi:hypothetical protein
MERAIRYGIEHTGLHVLPDRKHVAALLSLVDENDVMMKGVFHYVLPDGRIIGCPLTQAFDLPKDGTDAVLDDLGIGSFASYFYPKWDELVGDELGAADAIVLV